jgi:hypothetical protein
MTIDDAIRSADALADRCLASSDRASVMLPFTAMSPPSSSFDRAIAASASPRMRVVFCHPTDSSVVERTNLQTWLTKSA